MPEPEIDALGLAGMREAVLPSGVRLLSGKIPPGQHDAVWRRLLDHHPATGWYPVLGQDVESAAVRAAQFPADVQGPEALVAARAADPVERMRILHQSALEETTEECDEEEASEWYAAYDPATVVARFDAVSPPARGVHRETDGHPPTQVLLVEAAQGYEVPVLVPGLIHPNWYGGPSYPSLIPEDHLAVLRLWHERHGAELYYAGGTSLELSVARPPTTKAEVARCAVEQSVYCHDLLGIFGKPADVAVKQVSNHHWSFWWD
ncbi:uncharacterized protein DUF4253 [Actinoplanes italicus]|uniref:Uncharacterized protein DUF4253 n=2 Tax=Actinoplanes italicus TaxID=113567 RepID=A0A2T0JWM2_9ACTN|nr:uncharacterized protein DUF4253 [Actinoplanes italicus]